MADSSKKIMLVAGDYNLVEPVQNALKDKRFALQNAYTHRQAVYMLKDEKFDVIIVDSAMFDRHSGAITVATLAGMKSGASIIMIALDGEPMNTPQATVITDTRRETVRAAVFQSLSLEDEPRKKSQTQYLTNTNAYAERRIEEIQTLFALGKTLTEVLDLSEVLNRIVEAARRLTNAEEGMILMPDDEGGELYLRARVGIDVETARNFRVRTADTIAGEVLKSGFPSLIGAKGPQKVKTQYFVNSLLYVPISLQGKTIGVLGVNNKSRNDLFDANHQELLMNLASYAAIAIENARIHEDSLQRARELSSLVEASRIVNSSLAMAHALPNICEQLARILNVSSAEIYDWNMETSRLECIARYQRAIWQLKQGGPRVRLAHLPALKTAIDNDSLLVVSLSDVNMSAEAAYLRHIGANTMLFVPVSAQGRPVGALQAFYIEAREQMTSSVSLGQARHAAMEALAGLLTQPGQPPTTATMQMLDRIRESLDADWYQLSVMSQDNATLVVNVEIGNSVWLQPPYPTIDLARQPKLLQVLETQSFVTLYADSQQPSEWKTLLNTNAGAMLVLPLIQRGSVHGVVTFWDTHRTRVFSDRDIDIGKAIVGQAATALENAGLVRELEQRLEQLKDAQDRLVQTARLSAMGELAAVVAHQINNPLTTIIADAELMFSDEPEGTPNYEALEAILRAGKRAASVARRLLSISRPEEPDAPPERIDVTDTINGVLTLVKTHIERDGIQVLVTLPDAELPPVAAVRGRLDDVWLNLLLNAHDALQGTKNAKIGIELHPALEKGYLDVLVWDNGPGIPEHIRNEVFKPFFTTKPAGEGTGLGLHICKQTVENVGGTMSVENQNGGGARFLVRLPILNGE